jgi:hypothetical protein
MEVFLLTFYLCSIMGDGDISEQVCKWQHEQYYDSKEECKAKAENILEQEGVDRVVCTQMRVL